MKINKVNTAILIAQFIFLGIVNAQVNILDALPNWTEGSGSTNGYSRYGATDESQRVSGTDPFGNQSILWLATPNNSPNGVNGGWTTDFFNIDHTQTYMYTVWFKRGDSSTGRSVLAAIAEDGSGNRAISRLNGTSANVAVFNSTAQIPTGQWYLAVGYMRHSSYNGPEESGIYDPDTGDKIFIGKDYRFSANATVARHRAYLSNGNTGEELSFFDPRVYLVNGQEPSVQQLLTGTNSNNDTQPPTPPSLVSTGHTDTTADLNWSGATDNVGVTSYTLYNGGTVVAENIGSSPYTATGLTPSTSYDFTVRARDAAGNLSADSNVVTITTDASSSNGGGSSGSGGSSVWSEANNTASYSGDVAIGATSVPSGYKLAVDGKIRTREVRVDQDTWPDYVFKDGYDLPTLEEVKRHIEEKGHLPNIPSATEVEVHGVELGEMNKLLLKKIEELTLYLIEQKSINEEQAKKIKFLEEKISGTEKN